jgi:hypothetical protein
MQESQFVNLGGHHRRKSMISLQIAISGSVTELLYFTPREHPGNSAVRWAFA